MSTLRNWKKRAIAEGVSFAENEDVASNQGDETRSEIDLRVIKESKAMRHWQAELRMEKKILADAKELRKFKRKSRGLFG